MSKVFQNLLRAHLFWIIFIFAIFLFPLLHPGLHITHDGENHVARIASYYQALLDGQFPPRWAGNLNLGYGSPVFIFFYPLPSLLGTVFHMVGFGFENAFKIVVGLSFIAAPVSFYFWLSSFLKKEIAFFGSFLYGLAPYHFLDLYVRGDAGELLAFVFIPLVLFFIEKMLQTKSLYFILLGGICYALLILSHNGMSLIFSPVLLLYMLFRIRKDSGGIKGIFIFVIGLTLSSFFWLPALYEGKYVNAKLFIGQMFAQHFLTITQVIYSPWGFGSDVSKAGGLSPQIGIIYFILVVVSCIILYKQKKRRKNIFFWLIMFFVGVGLSLPFSTVVWQKVQLLDFFEFPWRFTALSSFAAAVLGCFVLARIKNKKLLFILLFILLFSSIPYIAVKGYTSRRDNDYYSFSGTTYFHGEASPIWTAGDAGKRATRQIEILSGEGRIKNLYTNSRIHSFSIFSKYPITILDNTVYFPGWKVTVDGKKVPIEFQDVRHRGLITFQVPQGIQEINVFFTESSTRLLADIISLLGFVVVIFLFFSQRAFTRLGLLK